MTKTLRSIEVEPLSEQRWSKIERGLFARVELPVEGRGLERVPRARSALRFGLVAAALCALAAVALVFSGLSERPVVDHPSRITTGASASHLALAGLSLDVEPQSAVVIDSETQRGQLIVLDRGTIVCDVAKRSSGAPLIVQAGATRVRVIGTRFRVTRLGEAAHVQVHEGTVEVTSRGGTWRVKAGEEWPPPAPGESAQDEAVTQTPPAVAPPKAIAEARVPERAVSEGAPHTPSAQSAPSTPRRSVAPARSAREELDASASEPPPTAPKRAPSAQTVFEQAAALERSDPARASDLYRSLESGADSWAQNALYARARLAASRGNAGEAKRLLQRYLDRFPRGSNSEDARAVLRRLR